MTIMPVEVSPSKRAISDQLEALNHYVEMAATSGTGVHEVELGIWRGLLALGGGLLGYFFHFQGNGDQGPVLKLDEGRELKRLEAEHTRLYQSIFGHFELPRCVYGSREGQRIESAPLDSRLQLPESQFSYLLQNWAEHLCMESSYQQVSALLEKLLGVKVAVSALERMNGAMGQAVEPYWETTEVAPTSPGDFIVVTADGKGVPIRKPAASAPIEAHDGRRGPKPDRKKIAILGAIYDSQAYPRTPEQVVQSLFGETSLMAANDEEFHPRPRPLAKAVRASLTDLNAQGQEISAREAIFTWLGEQLQQRDPEQNQPVVVIMDGQHCLWDDAATAVPASQRVEILDLLHATSKLWDAVHLFHPSGTETARKVMKIYTLMLLRGEIEDLVLWLRHGAEQRAFTGTTRERLNTICGYFEHHKSRMRYDRYLAAGYPIASGVIEGACRHVVKDRMERTGMRWTIPGAHAMLKLRCVAINDQWDEFTQFRIQRENQRLYPHAELFDTAHWPLNMAA